MWPSRRIWAPMATPPGAPNLIFNGTECISVCCAPYNARGGVRSLLGRLREPRCPPAAARDPPRPPLLGAFFLRLVSLGPTSRRRVAPGPSVGLTSHGLRPIIRGSRTCYIQTLARTYSTFYFFFFPYPFWLKWNREQRCQFGSNGTESRDASPKETRHAEGARHCVCRLPVRAACARVCELFEPVACTHLRHDIPAAGKKLHAFDRLVLGPSMLTWQYTFDRLVRGPSMLTRQYVVPEMSRS